MAPPPTSPRVLFRGPMLVLTRDTDVDSILIPDAHMNIGYPGEPGTRARQHILGMFVVRAGETAGTPASLTWGMNVTVDDGTGGTCVVDAASASERLAVDALINVKGKELIRPTGATNSRVASVVNFRGGTLGTTIPCVGSYHVPDFPVPRPVNIISEWSTTQPTVTITTTWRSPTSGEVETPIVLGLGDAAFIYNFDVPVNTEAEFCRRGPCVQGAMADDDFKWAYWMLEEPSKGWSSWLGGGTLPVPLHVCTSGDIEYSEKLASSNANAVKILSPGDGDCMHGYFDLLAVPT